MGNFFNNPNWDLDILFAYDTVREVKVRDRRLGFVYYFFLMAIVFYIVIWVFMIKKQYLAFEKTTGWTISRLMYHGHEDQSRVFDVFESLTADGAQGAVFIPTRVVRTSGQVQEGFCESPLHACSAPEDCDIGNEELQNGECVNGRCMRRQWCPAMEIDTPTTTVHYVDIHNYDIWFYTNFHFHMFALDVGNTDEKESVRYPPAPGKTANTYAVHDLLRLAGVDHEKVKDLGAIIDVNKVFDCNLDVNACRMNVQAGAVVGEDGSHQGFNYATQEFYDEGGVTKRTHTRYYGIRVYVSATGIGKKSSFANIVLQVSSAIALLSCAVAAADVVLQYVIPERKHYIELKIIDTEDFNALNP